MLDHAMSLVELEIAAHSSKNNKIKQLQYLTIVSYHKVEIKLNYLSTNVNIYTINLIYPIYIYKIITNNFTYL